ncbi:DgyrCDS7429 [Dimorphilus gyrociliatus]|uniref:DgyrCDS7429 n=1 Tax=Dimorphilus gyrociliatus TaxID=2664684 RepID=A0A7I8VVZ2_9ANNE|nr:DgyrCDS7429 [Dimorphilus gyrociliatus]
MDSGKDWNEDLDMSYIENRKKSFLKWKYDDRLSVTLLIDSFFYYLGEIDATKCFSCNLVVKDWKKNSKPLTIHTLLSQNCPMIKEYFNEYFMNNNKEELILEYENKLLECQPLYPDMMRYSCRLESLSEYDISLLEKELCATTGFIMKEKQILTCFHCGCSLRGENIENPFQEHAKFQPYCLFLINRKGAEFVDEHKLNFPVKDENYPREVRAAIDTDVAKLLSELKDWNIVLRSIEFVCNEMANVVTLPCGCLAVCSKCADSVVNCQRCGTFISGTVLIFQGPCTNDRELDLISCFKIDRHIINETLEPESKRHEPVIKYLYYGWGVLLGGLYGSWSDSIGRGSSMMVISIGLIIFNFLNIFDYDILGNMEPILLYISRIIVALTRLGIRPFQLLPILISEPNQEPYLIISIMGGLTSITGSAILSQLIRLVEPDEYGVVLGTTFGLTCLLQILVEFFGKKVVYTYIYKPLNVIWGPILVISCLLFLIMGLNIRGIMNHNFESYYNHLNKVNTQKKEGSEITMQTPQDRRLYNRKFRNNYYPKIRSAELNSEDSEFRSEVKGDNQIRNDNFQINNGSLNKHLNDDDDDPHSTIVFPIQYYSHSSDNLSNSSSSNDDERVDSIFRKSISENCIIQSTQKLKLKHRLQNTSTLPKLNINR